MRIVSLVNKSVPPEAKIYGLDSTRLMLPICRELAWSSSNRIFFLSVRKAGELIDVSHTQAGRLFEMFCADELLIISELGSHKSQRATRYEYLGTMENVIECQHSLSEPDVR